MADQPPFSPEKVDQAVKAFEARDLESIEALMASVKLMVSSLARFRADAGDFRERLGEERAREFATVEFNELVYEIQDAVPVAVRVFNSLMRDKDSPRGPADPSRRCTARTAPCRWSSPTA